ncbi:MAG: hypothetical protein LH702_20125 [Phormidesmis sp. CAN_BIN44]|nr:hypothetical protein [Phormidesmis sp. CAN_BIN44]
MGGQLACKEFQWCEWLKPEKPGSDNVSDWVERFEKDYFSRRSRTPKSETTWRIDYALPLRELPPNAPLTADLLRQAIN